MVMKAKSPVFDREITPSSQMGISLSVTPEVKTAGHEAPTDMHPVMPEVKKKSTGSHWSP